MGINISKLCSIQLCALKGIFLARTNGVSEIALQVPNHVVTCENKDKKKIFFPMAWGDGKNKGKAVW